MPLEIAFLVLYTKLVLLAVNGTQTLLILLAQVASGIQVTFNTNGTEVLENVPHSFTSI